MIASATGTPGSSSWWRRHLIDVYLAGWACGATISSLGLLLRREDIAAGSQWLTSSWQREIGLWNIVIIGLIAQALVTGNGDIKLAVVRAGVLASLLLGSNHLLTLLSADDGPIRLHFLALGGNSLNLGAAIAVLLTERRSRTTGIVHASSAQLPAPQR